MSKRDAKEEDDDSDDDSGSGDTGTETETESEEEIELQPWRHSIFGCFDHGLQQCCALLFLDCCVYGNAISKTFHEGQCCCYFCCCTFGYLFCCCNRAKIRAKYALEAHNLGPCGEVFSALCCPCCFRAQQVLELETRQGTLYGVCGAKRGDPRRPAGTANTGGGMSRGPGRGSSKVVPGNKVVPLDTGTKTVSLQGSDAKSDDDNDRGLDRSPSGRLIDTAGDDDDGNIDF
jgi:Cys-rich protein (TIGR01571 family)